ncbi:protein SUPPRESSOR OF npr1-1, CONSTITUTIVE 1-like [Eucalyptus grandis]|uniref:protein SUPPRESSOR OF npr1-1, CONSTITUTIVE 1-like n=1 Tax=Eucalyptus grandis TaxID=71139 RepID=UPI00192EA091|nr:protein SUPPRESSOR OF npr1-1, CONSTITUTIVE 1-like [Eucalyptus grandis]XP_039159730.1 protein SUPPRESSOR OF npr1-1, CONSTITUTIVE 1-like [Eucalyptus grandis]XP_039159731.1 protein SUPPRESSOR OF npr1-1, CONSTITUTIVE 1-like [Eucalyptus grandis]XP_039159732.1 protein SUPPRESSOR OF npr1-1, CONSTITUTIVE 1-like [Eucalyptus grandis]
MYMWEDYGFYPSQGIEELKLRCLIKIGDHGEFLVHDQLRDLGRSIFCQGQPLEKRSGPWDDDYKGVPKVLEINAQGRPAWFPSRSPSWFRKILWRHLSCFRFRDNLRAAASGTSNDELLSEVRWLKWRIVQSDLSPSMHLSNLSILDLYGCEIGEYWQGWRSFMASKRLKVLKLENCHNLRRTPDLSVFTQLKILILWNCEKLKHLHPSIGKLTSLVSLNLLMCKRLKELPEEMDELKDLEELFLCNSSIIKIPMSIGSLRKLKTVCTASYKKDHLWEREIFHLNGTSIFNQPESIFAHHLCRRGNDKLRSVLELPSSLQCLDLRGSNKLQSLPELPSSLQHLLLQGCKELRSLPKLPSSLQSLDLQKCEELRSLPSFLRLSRSLPKLPSSCQSLDLRGCRKLQLLPELPSSLQMLDLFFCLELQSLPELPSSLQYLDLRAVRSSGRCQSFLLLSNTLT